jgi:hypothetical protein
VSGESASDVVRTPPQSPSTSPAGSGWITINPSGVSASDVVRAPPSLRDLEHGPYQVVFCKQIPATPTVSLPNQPSATSPLFFDNLHFEHFDKSVNHESVEMFKMEIVEKRGLVADGRPKRRFWNDEQKMQSGFSKPFSRA